MSNMSDDDSEVIRRLWSDPSCPAAFSSSDRMYKHLKATTHPTITRQRVQTALEGLLSFGLHREFHKVSKRSWNPYFVRKRRQLVQIDLVDISALANQNEGIKFLLLIIDCFTKFAWVYPLLSKHGERVCDSIKKWVTTEEAASETEIIQSDLGTEFYCRPVKALFKQFDIRHLPSYGMSKSAIVERFAKTIQLLIYTFLSSKETLIYHTSLQDLVGVYNSRQHRSLDGLSPHQADQLQFHDRVLDAHERRWALVKRRQPKFPLGAVVRIKLSETDRYQNRKSYSEKFSLELYRVVRINKRLPNPTYTLSSLNTRETIAGSFYANELRRVRLKFDTKYKIEAVLDRRHLRGRQPEVLVKWQGFDLSHASWEPVSAISSVD